MTTLNTNLKQAEQHRIAADILTNGHEWEWLSATGHWKPPTPGIDPATCVYLREEIRVKPWTLGRSINGHTLAEGQEWSTPEGKQWTEEMLPHPYRPLIIGTSDVGVYEGRIKGDDWGKFHGDSTVDIVKDTWAFWRTTRPIPQLPLKWAAEREAFARGEKIECYRIKPTPALVELCAADAPAGSSFRRKDWEPDEYMTPFWVNSAGFHFASDNEALRLISWQTAMNEGWLILRPGEKPAPCHKPKEGA